MYSNIFFTGLERKINFTMEEKMEIRIVEYESYKDCYELILGDKKMVITTRFGPRILHFGFLNKRNILYVSKNEDLSKKDEFIFYGGHRLWIAPERIYTYHPDNHPCTVDKEEEKLMVTSHDPVLHINKSITIMEKENRIFVRHGIINVSDYLFDGALWAITCVIPEGTAFLPWCSHGNWKMNKIIYWQSWIGHSTNMDSEQYKKTNDLFLITPNGEEGKVGTTGDEGFIGVTHKEYTFIKKFDQIPLPCYPDDNCAVQSYQCRDFVELETLSPIVPFPPGISREHTEEWILTQREVNPEKGEEVRALL
jgi:hypothetical protein